MTKEQRQVIATLRRARKLISKPERWTKGCSARGIDGTFRFASDKDAVCFCAIGAIDRCGGQGSASGAAIKAIEYGLPDIVDWNDHPRRKHIDVIRRFDRTIARLEGAK
jgi:hypothetical protein